MARHTFFSFHYKRDIWRVNQIRNSWVTQGNTTADFWDDAKLGVSEKTRRSSYKKLD